MDWKVRKNLAAGRGERGTEIIHFERAFHGRSGYTLSLTNTDPRKIAYFAKFPWPRIVTPSLDFSLPPAQREAAVVEKEQLALQQIRDVLAAESRGHRRHHHRADPGRGRRQPFPRRVPARAAADLRRARPPAHLRRSPVRHGHHRQELVLPAFRRAARPARLRQEGPGLRRHGRAAPGRGQRQLLPPPQPHQLDLGRQLHRLCPLHPLPADHRAGTPGRERARQRRMLPGRTPGPGPQVSRRLRRPRPRPDARLRSAQHRRRAMPSGRAPTNSACSSSAAASAPSASGPCWMSKTTSSRQPSASWTSNAAASSRGSQPSHWLLTICYRPFSTLTYDLPPFLQTLRLRPRLRLRPAQETRPPRR